MADQEYNYAKKGETPNQTGCGGLLSACLPLVILVIIVTLLAAGGTGYYTLGVYNESVDLINQMVAKRTENESEFDNMKKTIGQVAQVSGKQMESLKDIFAAHAAARTGENKGGSYANWIRESIPNIDTTTFNNVQRTILASRDRWTARQRELIQLKLRHDNMIDKLPSSIILKLVGHEKQEITTVTSTDAKQAFSTGTDDDTKVFK
ncbi:MAG: hypothetical protein ACYTGH_18890 [Planctomycetota bacterium]|jgi:hypothetical protein